MKTLEERDEMTSSATDAKITAADKSGAIRIRRYNSCGKGGQHSNKSRGNIGLVIEARARAIAAR